MPAPAAASPICGNASRASASARCATRSPSTSATPSGGRSRDRSRRATTSTRSTRRCPAFLQREDSYALPKRQRHLTALILRKLLASSSQAIAATLDTLRTRLETLRDEKVQDDAEFTEGLIEAEEIEDDLLDEILAEPDEAEAESAPRTIDRQKLREEIDILQRLATWARSIGTDTKTKTLLTALDIGFEQMAATGAARKALIFTESRRTQEYLKTFLESHGYRGQVVLFNGTNGGPEATAIYERWVEKNRDTGRSSGSRAVDVRTALIEHFRDEGSILLATEAAAEGINLQFCSLVINYDLPWNPQRIEQRIGRCHRYGQRHDVVVINFLNERNEADRRVLELLGEKFSLFNGVFGASDEVLGHHRVRRGLREAHPRHLPGVPHARGDRRRVPYPASGNGRADPHAHGRHAPDAVRALRRGRASTPAAAARRREGSARSLWPALLVADPLHARRSRPLRRRRAGLRPRTPAPRQRSRPAATT